MADDGILGMLSGMFGVGAQPDPTAPMQILPQVQQDAMSGQPSFLDALKASLAKNGPQAFSAAANQFAPKPMAVPPLPPIQFPQRPQSAYGSLIPPRIGS